ncbi:PAS domain S-box [Xenococcus sp. PCC 7305]|uniref:SpoIIE family protein phosphatase n=1 Tax=Xenococcus sp. PCC 7305 TaxID=102125 RepID=UPI0002ACBC42|nr:SpoIIE family protein phosphatase [Xenococcus sp. PCC 7305]ELS00525.1 PAS domain S-box [Xenococcus sp. PCC 7305]
MNLSITKKAPIILIADDEISTRRLLRLILNKEGYQVIETENGQDCLNAFNLYQPEIVLLDAIMPIMDGFTCCRKLNQIQSRRAFASDSFQQIPILMITGLDDRKSVDLAFEAGAIDYITKPLHRDVLRQRLRYLLEAKWAQEALREKEQKYRLVVNNLREGIFQLDLEDNLTFLNPAWQEITGFSVEESLGQKLSTFIHDEYILVYQNYLKLLLTQNQPECSFELQYHSQNGDVGWIKIYACPIQDSDRNIIGISGTINNITKQKLREIYQKVDYQTTKVLAESLSIKDAITNIIQIICNNLGWQLGEFWKFKVQDNCLSPITSWSFPGDKLTHFIRDSSEISFLSGQSLVGTVWETENSLWIDELIEHPIFLRTDLSQQADLVTSFGFLVFHGLEKLGIITLFCNKKKQEDPELLRLMTTLGSQIGQFIKRKQAEIKLQQQNKLLQSELKQAGKYVISLLPSPLQDKVQIQHLFIPSIDLGGDIFDYYWLDEQKLVIYLLDVSGHGVRPALLSVSVQNLLRSQSLSNIDFSEPNTVVSELNRMFQMDERGENYFTIWYGVYDILERKLVYCSAAHPPALLIYPQKNNQLNTQQLSNENIPVGMLSEFEFEQSVCDVRPNSSLYLFSDGVYEIATSENKTWGIDALSITLEEYYQNSSQPHSNLSSLLQKIQQINPQENFGDDFSLIEIHF